MKKLENTPQNIHAFLGTGAALGAIGGGIFAIRSKDLETVGNKIFFVFLTAAAGMAIGVVAAAIFIDEPKK